MVAIHSSHYSTHFAGHLVPANPSQRNTPRRRPTYRSAAAHSLRIPMQGTLTSQSSLHHTPKRRQHDWSLSLDVWFKDQRNNSYYRLHRSRRISFSRLDQLREVVDSFVREELPFYRWPVNYAHTSRPFPSRRHISCCHVPSAHHAQSTSSFAMARMLPFACRLAGSALLFQEAVPLRQTIVNLCAYTLFFFMICFAQSITLLRIFRLDISSALPTSVRTVLSSKDCSSMNLSVRSCRANQV